MMLEDEQNTQEDFISKIEWEGGIISAIEYGLKSEDYSLPEGMANEWDALRARYTELAPLLDAFAEAWIPDDE